MGSLDSSPCLVLFYLPLPLPDGPREYFMTLFNHEKLDVYKLAIRFVPRRLPRAHTLAEKQKLDRDRGLLLSIVSMLTKIVHSRNGAGQGQGRGTSLRRP
jgi:hypothetical protein